MEVGEELNLGGDPRGLSACPSISFAAQGVNVRSPIAEESGTPTPELVHKRVSIG